MYTPKGSSVAVFCFLQGSKRDRFLNRDAAVLLWNQNPNLSTFLGSTVSVRFHSQPGVRGRMNHNVRTWRWTSDADCQCVTV